MTQFSPLTEIIELDDHFMQAPHTVYAGLNEKGPLHQVKIPPGVPVCGGLTVWLVTGYEEVRSALSDPRLSTDLRKTEELFAQNQPDATKRGGFSSTIANHMLHNDPPNHTRLRKLVNKAFTSRAVERLAPQIEKVSHELLDALPDDETVDLLDLFAFPLTFRIICALLGVPEEDQEDFKEWSKQLISGGSAEIAAAASATMHDYLTQLVARKRREPAADVLSALVEARDADDRLEENELISMAFLLIIGAHETTANTVANGTLHLMTNLDQWNALLADRSLLPGAIEEFLRLESPLKHATFRCVTEPVQIGDVELPVGAFVLISLAAANRHANRFEGDTQQLDISRPAKGHIAFGHGIHYCLGAPLARLETQIAFNALLDRYPEMRLAAAPADLRWRTSTLIRGLYTLPIRLIPA
ncbi:cytochrome P450 [Streptomyces lacrimifluminis]|uniref:Cytochrome P450 n=1 Tax=Streptomyces lacrimifluminis TaxID=1500077 RepID=A0A917PD06_9ACTN|nr:cytochrome P450 [Streptomyces lacrimifluminis]GGJ71234.1 cytochrome P450 [Streptomyces lacrimifluminis]